MSNLFLIYPAIAILLPLYEYLTHLILVSGYLLFLFLLKLT